MAREKVDPLWERAIHRAWRDTRHWSTNTLLSLLWLGACGAAGGVYGPGLLGHVNLHPHLATIIGALTGIVIGLALAVLARLLMTLQLQRNEARTALENTVGERDDARRDAEQARTERDDARKERDGAQSTTHVENQWVIQSSVSAEQAAELFRQAGMPIPLNPPHGAEQAKADGSDQKAPD